MLFKYGDIEIEIPKGHEFVYYATFIAGEYDYIKVRKDDIVLDAGAFIGDYTLKVAKKVKEVVAVEPLPWAFELLKKNVERNELKNVTLINKALYDVDTVLHIQDEGTGSKIGEREIQVKTITIDELDRKFSVMKMDIEGAEGRAIKGDYINYVREIAIELHGKDNIDRVSRYLREQGFQLTEMGWKHLLLNAWRNMITHLPSFISAERKTKIMSLALFKRRYNVPSIEREDIKIVYGKRLSK
ncbi:FkbM family methyltransferase [Metallosphaera javensis (ex Sakai et al. 2022)]|uniref:FkbM family methyltransferase n=1 Tax=Metallosphaera javensis (ex Sakai et al. 2022) TaxID=2775498 RepID=UPI00258BD753|nr:MAG: hexuronic acid methyltransferase AglP [Metallosphaera javensis (ex Sakai et al. 2022)]